MTPYDTLGEEEDPDRDHAARRTTALAMFGGARAATNAAAERAAVGAVASRSKRELLLLLAAEASRHDSGVVRQGVRHGVSWLLSGRGESSWQWRGASG